MAYCKIKFDSCNAASAISNFYGSNTNAAVGCLNAIFDKGDLKSDFKVQYREKFGTEPTINMKSKKFVQFAVDYYKRSGFDVDRQSTVEESKNDYHNIGDRDKGIAHIANIMLDIYQDIFVNKLLSEENNTKDYYITETLRRFDNLILQYVSRRDDISIDSLRKELDDAEVKGDKIHELVDKGEYGIIEQNLLALYDELHQVSTNRKDEDGNPIITTYNVKYFEEVLHADKLNGLFDDTPDEDKLQSNKFDEEDSNKVEEESTTSSTGEVTDSIDDSISNYGSHGGHYSTYMKHVSARLANYFNTLRKQVKAADSRYVEDTNNDFGIAETMDAAECSMTMFSRGRFFSNPDTMIKEIRKIAKEIPGYESFAKFADDLEANIDLQLECFRTFSKSRIAKLIIRRNESGSTAIESNRDSSKEEAFLFDIESSLRSSVIDVNTKLFGTKLSSLKEEIAVLKNNINQDIRFGRSDDHEEVKTHTNQYNAAVKSIIELVKTYFPNISEKAITAFIEQGNNASSKADYISNISKIISLLEGTNTAAVQSKKENDKIESKIKSIKEYNDNLRKSKDQSVLESDYKKLDEAFDEDFLVPDQMTNARAIRDLFLDYEIVQLTFNNHNADNKLASDIINTSLVTRLVKIFESGDKDLILQWGRNKLRSHHSKFSTLFLTQRDDKGQVISEGIFEYVGGRLRINERIDGADVFKLYLFDGAKNEINGKSAMYSRMLMGDFSPTVYDAYWSPITKNNKVKSANYFLRTPSDAPKTFTFRGVRYDTSDLYKFEDEKAVENVINQAIKNVDKPNIPQEEKDEVTKFIASINANIRINDKNQIDVSPKGYIDEDAFYNVLRGERYILAANKSFVKKIGDKSYTILPVKYDVRQANGNIVSGFYYYVVRGDEIKRGNAVGLTNVELLNGVTYKRNIGNREHPEDVIHGIHPNTKAQLKEIFRDNIEHGINVLNGVEYDIPKRVINRDSKVFKMFMLKAKQELYNMLCARDYLFETNDDGSIKFVEDEFSGIIPKFKQGKNNTSGYDNYHKKGKVFNYTDFGVELTGNVFHSNIFTLFKDGKTVNYLDQIITQELGYTGDDKINILYNSGNEEMRLRGSKQDGVINNIILNDKQQALIADAVQNYLEDYIQESVDKVQQYSQFISKPTDVGSVIDFAVNYYLALNSFDELFEGSSKFYKDSRNILKRAKESQGSGVPLGIADYTQLDDTPGQVVKTLLNTGRIIEHNAETGKADAVSVQDIFKGTILEGLQSYNSFRAVTVKNTIKTNTPALKEIHRKLVEDIGVDPEIATSLLYGAVQTDENGNPKIKNGEVVRSGGFTDTKVNDAQSYITFKEWVRRVAAKGELTKYMPLIKRILQAEKDGTTPNASDIKEFIQVQKNFYYDLHYDEEARMEVPRQIKNAEFVLVPCLIKGTELEQVYNMMEEAGIDQLNTVETSKAANKEVLTLWDNNGDITEERLANFADEAKAVASDYFYNYLYTQQETPQHINAENKAGIQIIKKLIDNIPDKGHPLSDAKGRFNTLMSANIQDSANQLLKELEYSVDENGIVSINKDVFYEKLQIELARRGSDNNNFDYVTKTDDTDAEPRMPIVMNHVLNTFESIVQSVFNNRITRQTLPGFHAAQVTNVGWKAGGKNKVDKLTDAQLRKDEEFIEWAKEEGYTIASKGKIDAAIKDKFKEYLKSKTDITYDKDLKYHQGADGKYTEYIEVMLPASNFGIDLNKGRYKYMTKEEILKELQDEGLDMVIGYRIPTEGKQSCALMKVVGFTDDIYGSTIVVPDDWVSQTGSDFDIDSVYGIQFPSYVGADGKLHRVRYKENAEKEVSIHDYYNYIKRNVLDNELPEKASAKFKKAFDEIHKSLSDAYLRDKDAYDKTLEDCFNLENEEDEDLIGIMSSVEAGIEEVVEEVKSQGIKSKREYNIRKYAEIVSFIDSVRNNIIAQINEVPENIDSRLKAIRLAAQNVVYDLQYQGSEYVKESVNNDILDELEPLAEAYGLKSFDEYKATPYHERCSRQARYAGILEAMEEILSSDYTLEEQMSRSNFDDIITALNDTMNPAIKRQRKDRSPYNIWDQISYQEDAMSGAMLKAMSVSLDTFCSVCNKTQPVLNENDEVYIVYNRGDIDADTAKRAFADANEPNKTNNTTKIEPIKYVGTWSRASAANDSRTLYIFTDNTDRDSGNSLIDPDSSYAKKYGKNKHYPKQTQAVIRGLPNAMPLSTQRWYHEGHKGVSGRWTDDAFDEFKKTIDAEIEDIKSEWLSGKYDRVAFGSEDGLFNTKISNISKERVPKIYDYLTKKYNELKEFINEHEQVSEVEEDNKITKTNGVVSIKHKQYGWSNNNKNIVGKILTAYSSQTTAHILDQIKEGSIPNVNEYSFGVYKTLANLGVDFKTIVSFMMQPGVSYFIDAYNEGNSVYFDSFDSVFNRAIKKIAEKLGVNIEFGMSINNILAQLQDTYGEQFRDIFGEYGDDVKININEHNLAKLPILTQELVDRLKNKGKFSSTSPVEEMLFDLGVMLQFYKLNKTASEIQSIASVCNTDKFGAGASMFDANKRFDDIYKCVYDNSTVTRQLRPNPVLQASDGSHILTKIYPGIDKEYVNNGDTLRRAILENDENVNSAYPIIYAHLKYGTATAASIGSDILLTQDPAFVYAIKYIARKLTNNFKGELTKELYDDYQKYILNYMYNHVDSIAMPLQFTINEKTHELEKVVMDNGASIYEETKRIFGYDRPSIVGWFESNDEVKRIKVPFEVNDKHNPTQAELDNFAKLSPAQKVKWIQNNSDNAGVFSYLDVELYNPKASKDKVGQQLIRFNDNGVTINTIRTQFKLALNSTNPFIKMAAFDLVKYAAQVEGFRMSKTAVNKVIDNSALYTEFGLGGFGFTSDIIQQFANIDREFDKDKLDELAENFIRSKTQMKEIGTFRLSTAASLERIGINKYRNGMFIAEFNPKESEFKYNENSDESEEEQKEKWLNDKRNEWLENLVSTKVAKQDNRSREIYQNEYIYIQDNRKYGGDKQTHLYKIIYKGNYVIFIPLNPLQANECSEWSVNPDNNTKFWSKQAYNAFAESMPYGNYDKETANSLTDDVFANYKSSDLYYRRHTTEAVHRANVEGLQERLDSPDLYKIKGEIFDHFVKNEKTNSLYVIDSDLSKYIFDSGRQGAAQVVINFEDVGPLTFRITKPNSIKEASKQRDDINDGNSKHVYNVTRLYPSETNEFNDIRSASIVDLDYNAVEYMASVKASNPNDEGIGQESTVRLQRLNENNIKRSQAQIENNTEFVTRQVAGFANNAASIITDNFEKFVKDPENPEVWLSADNEKVQQMLIDDPRLVNKYFKVMLDIKAFKTKFEAWQSAKSDDRVIQTYINTINNAYNRVSSIPVDDADKNFTSGYIKKLSTNPIVKQDLVDIMSGFYKTVGSAWAFHDILENGNILLQTILKDVMGDIEAKRLAVNRAKKAYRDKIADIKKRAAEHGVTVDINKFIGPDGRFIEDYVKEFTDKIEELRENANNAATEHGYGSIEHLEAKLAYDEFKAYYTNQEADADYYKKKCHAERVMLYGDESKGIAPHKELYSHYMKLYYDRLSLYNFVSESGNDPEIENRIDALTEEMYNLLRDKFYVDENGSLEERPNRQPNTIYTPEEERKLTLYSNESQWILSNFVKSINNLNLEYFEYVPDENFEPKLKENLRIIASFEKRDANGVPTVPRNILESNEDYVAARDWIRQNAYFELTSEDPDGLAAKVSKAMNRLSRGGNGKFREVNEIIRKATKERPEVRDAKNVVDGTKLTEEEVKRIREITESKYKSGNMPPFSDRVLINSAKQNDTVYTENFYKKCAGNGNLNPEYIRKVTALNNILRKYYSEVTNTLDFTRMKDDAESIKELKTIAVLLDEIRSIKKRNGSTNGKEVKEFIEENTTTDINDLAYNAQFADLSKRSTEFKRAWALVNCQRENGVFVKDEHGNYKPNELLYGSIRPKDEVADKYIDHQKTEDLALLNSTFRTSETSYYTEQRNAAEIEANKLPTEQERRAKYLEWFMTNHVYNPYTHKMEPLGFWLTKEYKDEAIMEMVNEGEDVEGKWMPKASQREKKVREEKSNKNYNKDLGVAGNYIKGTNNGQYDSKVNLNEYELEMRDYLKNTLYQTASTDQAKRYFKRGYLPARAKQPGLGNGKQLLKEIGKLFGIGISSNNGTKEYYNEIGYDKDITPLMPLTKQLRSDDTKPFDEKKPKASDYGNTPEEIERYNKDLDAWKKAKKEVDDYNKKIHNDLLDKDWLNVIEDYLELAGRYNAIMDNKVKLYYLLDKLRNQKAYIKSWAPDENLKKDKRRGDKDNPVYDTAVDNELVKQYENFLRRLMFDQWKDETQNLTRFANNLQSFTSANYMMLNFRGGIANVTVGKTGMLAEAVAKEFFNYRDWKRGELDWTQGIISYGRAIGKEFAYSKQDAIIKAFKVVDYDEHTGVVREADYAKMSKKIRDAMFTPQTMGEHFMQNSVLFAMLHSHKIVELPGDPKGIGFVPMNLAEYIRVQEASKLTAMLNEEQLQKFEEFKKNVKADANELAEYAWFRRDTLTDFVYLHCTKEQIENFKVERKKIRDKAKEEFKAMPDMYSQIKLGEDGKMAFEDGSMLYKLNQEFTAESDGNVTKTEAMLGNFTNRVRLVNNKIHGVYNRLGSAYIEKTWIGSLIMQYHKHLPMGLLKRYATRGHYNEIRGSVDKGMIASILDFLRLNLDKVKADNNRLTDKNMGALKSVQFLLAHGLEYATQLTSTWNIMQDYDKANIKRNIGDFAGVMIALLVVSMLLAGGDDDDDSLIYNLTLYEADRLCSESFLYNPVGLVNEGKKLMSTPIAAQSIVTDFMSSMYAITQAIWQGEDYDPYYHSGRFAGEHKLWVYIQRRTPMWNGIRGILDTPSNNRYYKVGRNPVSELIAQTKD